MMKKSCKMLLIGAALTVAMTASAGAASFTTAADSLNQMGLFSGTDKGYELDREPTRAEAGVMLVRLLGGEKEATEQSYTTPFTDVPDWAAPYVGWLYQNKLTAGATATTFGTSDKCTAQMYSAFLMRSLGYQDSGSAADFKYADAVPFATEKGVVDFVTNAKDTFLRDHVAAMSYTALSVQPKDAEHATLLDQLIDSGAIDSAKAAGTKANFDAYREYMALSEKQANIDSMAMTVKAAMDMKLNGANLMNVNLDMKMQARMDMDKMDASVFAMEGTATAKLDPSMLPEGEKQTTQSMSAGFYYKDGTMYTRMDDEKIKMPMSFDEILGSIDPAMMQTTPITMFDSITKNSDGSFKIVYAPDFMNNLIAETLKQAMDATTGVGATDAMTISKFDMTVTSKNGEISTMKAELNGEMNLLGQKMEMAMTIDYIVTATGNAVSVKLPSDLNTYKTLSE